MGIGRVGVGVVLVWSGEGCTWFSHQFCFFLSWPLLTCCFTMNIELFVVLDRVSRIVYMYILYLLLQAAYSWVRFGTYSSFGWTHLDRGLTGLGCLVRCLRGVVGAGRLILGAQ